jgi:hypothetical protein
MPRLPRRKRALRWVKASRFHAHIVAGLILLIRSAMAQEEPTGPATHEREELGVNRYSAPRIEHVFAQLDKLKPLPFAQLWRELPAASPTGREQKGLMFGGLIADGFLVVTAQRQNVMDELGRVLIREARGLGVADRVMRHSASLTELGRAGNWMAVRKELVATQADVEQAMIDLRDEKMAALISLGGWLRGLEIGAAAVEGEFSPDRARVLVQPELADYYIEELNTLPPLVAHSTVFEKLRAGLKEIRSTFSKAESSGLQLSQVKAIHGEARDLDLSFSRNN